MISTQSQTCNQNIQNHMGFYIKLGQTRYYLQLHVNINSSCLFFSGFWNVIINVVSLRPVVNDLFSDPTNATF